MRDLTGGVADAEVAGGSLRRVIAELDGRFPGLAERVSDGRRLTPGIAVSIDGEISTLGLMARIGEESEVHFIPAIAGGT